MYALSLLILNPLLLNAVQCSLFDISALKSGFRSFLQLRNCYINPRESPRGRFDTLQFSANIYRPTKDLAKRSPAFLKGANYDIMMAYSLLKVHPFRERCLPWPTCDFSACCKQRKPFISSTVADRSSIQKIIYRFLRMHDFMKLPIRIYDVA